MFKLTYYGHSFLAATADNCTLLFDPFITDNPACPITVNGIHCEFILVSHAHYDHLGDTVALATTNRATVISTAEVANLCHNEGCQVHAMHIGGQHAFPFGRVRITPAFHGAGVSGGHACGFIVAINGSTLYFAGDTSLFGDMELLSRLETIDCAVLPIGDNFTMGPGDALEAVKLLKPKHVIPVHYNTWPLITQNPVKFKRNVEATTSAEVNILAPGTTIDIP